MTTPGVFSLTTDWTGKRHTFTVEVWPSRETMQAHLDVVAPFTDWHETNDAGETPAGAFINAAGFMSQEAPANLGTIYLSEDHLDIDTLSHEVVHAAMFAYECDVLGNYSRATAHMTMRNEPIAYMIGSLMAQLAEQLLARGYYRTAAHR